MTTSDRAFVWAWLPGATEPAVCGVVERRGPAYAFAYGRSYLDHSGAIPLFDMPLARGAVPLPPGSARLHGSLRDALPDAWGQHVIASRILGRGGPTIDTGDVHELTYMLESGSDRFGAIDFQDSPGIYVPRLSGTTSLEQMAQAAADIEAGRPLPPAIADAFEHGTSIGGARPKVTTADPDGHWIVKLSSSADQRPAVRTEALALDLARCAGVDVVEHDLTRLLGRDALRVRRFDRPTPTTRTMAVSGLTMLRLDEMEARYASYPDLLDTLMRFGAPEGTRHELFRRVVVNIALGNDDDHARNHAALWDGCTLTLSPAYDIDPRRSRGWDSNQAMAYGRDGARRSNLGDLVDRHGDYGLTRREAAETVTEVVEAVDGTWRDALKRSGLTAEQGRLLRTGVILAAGALEGWH